MSMIKRVAGKVAKTLSEEEVIKKRKEAKRARKLVKKELEDEQDTDK